MSYSFRVVGATKDEAIAQAKAEFDKVVEGQPVHAADRAQAEVAVNSFISLLREDETQNITVSVSGSVWSAELGLNSASVQVSVSLTPK